MNKASPARAAPFEDMPVWKVLTYIGLQASVFTTIGAALWVLAGRSRLEFLTFSWSEAGAGLILAFGLIATSVVLARAYPKYADWLIRSQARNYSFLKHRISLVAIIFISLCAGVSEEALFRGGLQTLLGDILPMPIAVICAAALFAAIHFAQPLNSALIFIIGGLFGIVYWTSGSLLTVMVGHAVYDVYAIWALQEALHKLGVFDEESAGPLPDDALHETSGLGENSTGESP